MGSSISPVKQSICFSDHRAYLSGITGFEETGTSIEDCGSSVSEGLNFGGE